MSVTWCIWAADAGAVLGGPHVALLSHTHTGRVWQGSPLGISYWLSAVVVTACLGFTTATNGFHELNTHIFAHAFTPRVIYCIFLRLPPPLTSGCRLRGRFDRLVNADCKSHRGMIDVSSHLSSWLCLRLCHHLFHVRICTHFAQDNSNTQYPFFVLVHFVHMASVDTFKET